MGMALLGPRLILEEEGNDKFGAFGSPSLKHVARGWRGQWGLLSLPPSCLLPPPGWGLFPFRVGGGQEEALGSGGCWEGSIRGPRANAFLGVRTERWVE